MADNTNFGFKVSETKSLICLEVKDQEIVWTSNQRPNIYMVIPFQEGFFWLLYLEAGENSMCKKCNTWIWNRQSSIWKCLDRSSEKNSNNHFKTRWWPYLWHPRDQMSPMFEIMTSKEVTPRVQAIIERAFKTLLDNRTVLTRNIVLKVLSEFSPDSSSHSSDTSPSNSFTYSPKTTSTPKTPLQKFRWVPSQSAIRYFNF